MAKNLIFIKGNDELLIMFIKRIEKTLSKELFQQKRYSLSNKVLIEVSIKEI